MTPEWPAIPYKAQQDSYDLSLGDGKNVVSTDMDNGTPRSRRRFATTMSPTAFGVEMTSDDIELLKEFFKFTTKNGSLWFTMPIFDGYKYNTNLVKMATPPSIKPLGYDWFSVSFSLLVKELTLSTTDERQWLALLDEQSRNDFGDIVYHYVNEFYPALKFPS